MTSDLWSRERLAWLGGLFEGEGSISPRRGKRGRTRWFLQLSMTDEDTVQRAWYAAGVGQLYGPYPLKSGKHVWTWVVSKRAHVFALLAALYPFLGYRRQARAREALAALPPV